MTGRKNGIPNKLPSEAKDIIRQVVTKELKTFPDLMLSLEPKERIEMIIRLLPYVVPKAEPLKETEKPSQGQPNEFVSRIMEVMNAREKVKRLDQE